jgi:hypothetical protein
LLAINSLGKDNTADEMMHSNIQASNTWSFFQAKNIRQTANVLAADALELDVRMQPALAADVREAVQKRVEAYRATAARYEDEPDPKDPGNPLKGEGKKQLSAIAKNWEHARADAQTRGNSFSVAEAMLQIAIVVLSATILLRKNMLRFIGLMLALAGLVLTCNGYFGWFALPF